MSLGQIKDYTPNFNLIIPRFDIATWHDYMESNFRSIDALFFNMFGINQYRGEWQNSTTYQVGDVLFIGDPNSQYTGRLVKVLVAHTTTANDSFDIYYAHNPINYDLFMDAAAAEQAAKLARDWAIKTDGKVQGIDYSSKYYANLITPISAEIVNVSNISNEIVNVSSISSNITSVDANSTNINTVASMKPDVDDVVAIKSDIEWIADNDSIVINVSNNSTKITTVANNINSVNTNATNITDINTNASNISSINTTATNINDIITTVVNINDINTTAYISNDITTVANITSDVTSVANNTTNINSVASNNTNISAVANNETNINTVATNSSNINTVSTNISDVNTAATNIVAIQNALTYATNAANSASLAQDWAVKMDGLVSGEDYSAKYWADQARQSAAGAVVDNISINRNTDDELQTIGVINQNNTTTAIKTWTGTKAEYDALGDIYYNWITIETLYKWSGSGAVEDVYVKHSGALVYRETLYDETGTELTGTYEVGGDSTDTTVSIYFPTQYYTYTYSGTIQSVKNSVYTKSVRNPTTSTTIYNSSLEESSLTITSVSTDSIVLSDGNTYNYNQSGNIGGSGYDNNTLYNITDDNTAVAYQAYSKSETDSLLSTLLENLYPIGSVYLSIRNDNICPLSVLMPNTTWELVSTNRALWGGNGTNANTWIAAGLPNITGELKTSDQLLVYNNSYDRFASSTGALSTVYGAGNVCRNTGTIDYTANSKRTISFDASNSNSIYGNSSTVQPPAYVVNVWVRTV